LKLQEIIARMKLVSGRRIVKRAHVRHQGEKEKARRRKQMEKFMITPTMRKEQ